MKTTFEFISDPGHGWLRVPVTELNALGLVARDFSPYSYVSFNGANAYLEEDCDAPKFFRVYEAKHGKTPDIIEKHISGESNIRRMAPIVPWRNA